MQGLRGEAVKAVVAEAIQDVGEAPTFHRLVAHCLGSEVFNNYDPVEIKLAIDDHLTTLGSLEKAVLTDMYTIVRQIVPEATEELRYAGF